MFPQSRTTKASDSSTLGRPSRPESAAASPLHIDTSLVPRVATVLLQLVSSRKGRLRRYAIAADHNGQLSLYVVAGATSAHDRIFSSEASQNHDLVRFPSTLEWLNDRQLSGIIHFAKTPVDESAAVTNTRPKGTLQVPQFGQNPAPLSSASTPTFIQI